MRVVIQKVEGCSVLFNDQEIRNISKGYVIYLGIERGDILESILEDIESLLLKCNILDQNVHILILSQFTLFANLKKNKPEFHRAESHTRAKEIFYDLTGFLEEKYKNKVKSGVFGEYLDIKYNGCIFETMYFDFNK